MNFLPVSCAVLIENEKVLCAQRGPSMKMPFKWEFPGGKIEENETPEGCLEREIREELGIEIKILTALPFFSYPYTADFGIRLFPFLCKPLGGKINLTEHAQVAWLSLKELNSLDWAEADLPVVAYLQENPETMDRAFHS